MKGVVNFFSVDFNHIDANDILDTPKYLMKKRWHKIMLGIIKKMFIVLLSNIVNKSHYIKCVLLSNQKFMIQPILRS